MRCEYLVAVMVVWLISGLADARAQDSVTSPEIEQLERKLRTLELESQINAEKLKSWPSATVSAPSDSVTVENASYFPSVLAFRSLNAIAGGIADELEEAKETTDSEQKDKLIFLEWEDIFLQEALYDVTKSNLGEIQTGLDGVHRICKDTKEDGENCLKDPGKCEEAARKADAVESLMGPIIPIIPGLVGFAAQLRSFFNVERTIKGVVFKVESSALEAMLIENLSPNWEVLLPEISKTAGSEMLKALIGSIESAGKLETCRVDLLVQVGQFERWIERLQLGAAGKSDVNKGAILVAKNRRDNAEAVANTAATRLAAHKELVTALTAVSDSGSQSLIGQFHRVELLRDADLALSTKIEYSGGEVETTNSMWSQGRVSYLGGVTVSYKIIDLSTRTIRKSGVMTEARAASYKGRDGSGALKSLNPEMKE